MALTIPDLERAPPQTLYQSQRSLTESRMAHPIFFYASTWVNIALSLQSRPHRTLLRKIIRCQAPSIPTDDKRSLIQSLSPQQLRMQRLPEYSWPSFLLSCSVCISAQRSYRSPCSTILDSSSSFFLAICQLTSM